jgi:hypothetical protein
LLVFGRPALWVLAPRRGHLSTPGVLMSLKIGMSIPSALFLFLPAACMSATGDALVEALAATWRHRRVMAAVVVVQIAVECALASRLGSPWVAIADLVWILSWLALTSAIAHELFPQS